MHGEAEIPCPIQIGGGFGFAQSRAGDFVLVHALIIADPGYVTVNQWTVSELVALSLKFSHYP